MIDDGGYVGHPAIRKMLKLRHPEARYWLNVARAHDVYCSKLIKVLKLQGARRNAFNYEQFKRVESVSSSQIMNWLP